MFLDEQGAGFARGFAESARIAFQAGKLFIPVSLMLTTWDIASSCFVYIDFIVNDLPAKVKTVSIRSRAVQSRVIIKINHSFAHATIGHRQNPSSGRNLTSIGLTTFFSYVTISLLLLIKR